VVFSFVSRRLKAPSVTQQLRVERALEPRATLVLFYEARGDSPSHSARLREPRKKDLDNSPSSQRASARLTALRGEEPSPGTRDWFD